MKKHLNTLFVTLEGCWLSKDGDTVKVNAEGTCLLRVPLHNLEGIVTLGVGHRSFPLFDGSLCGTRHHAFLLQSLR